MTDSPTFRDAMMNSVKMVEENRIAEALKVVDEAITEAIDAKEESWVGTLCHHAAIIARHSENFELAKRYYEKSLASNPENARALYGLAFIASRQGDVEAAKRYAARCYKAITEKEEESLKDKWMELLLKNWPEVAEK